MEEQIQAVENEVVQEETQVKVRNYLNGQNRNTYAAFIRSRNKVVQPYGKTYNAGKNKAKAVRKAEKHSVKVAHRIAKRLAQVD